MSINDIVNLYLTGVGVGIACGTILFLIGFFIASIFKILNMNDDVV